LYFWQDESDGERFMRKLTIFLMLGVWLFASSVEVSVIKPTQNTKAITIQVDGVVVAKSKTIITAKANGILKLFIDNNSNVIQGQKIGVIVDERRVKRLELLRDKLLLVENQLESQKIKLADAKDMYKMGVGSKNNYLNEKVLQEQLKDNYQTLENEYKILKLEQTDSIIYAKENGTIQDLSAKNSYVSYGSKVATFLTKETMIKLFVDTLYAKKIKKGMLVTLDGDTKATIIYILSQSQNNLVEVMAKPNKPLPLNFQLSAKIELQNVNGLDIPKSAIVLVGNHPAVYVIKENKVHVEFVHILRDMIDRALIEDTLDKDTKVVFKNAYMLHDNLEVIIK
jgi:hypothetical protein